MTLGQKDMLIDAQALWHEYWRRLDMVHGNSIHALVSRGLVARGVEWALRSHDIATLKIMAAVRRGRAGIAALRDAR